MGTGYATRLRRQRRQQEQATRLVPSKRGLFFVFTTTAAFGLAVGLALSRFVH